MRLENWDARSKWERDSLSQEKKLTSFPSKTRQQEVKRAPGKNFASEQTPCPFPFSVRARKWEQTFFVLFLSRELSFFHRHGRRKRGTRGMRIARILSLGPFLAYIQCFAPLFSLFHVICCPMPWKSKPCFRFFHDKKGQCEQLRKGNEVRETKLRIEIWFIHRLLWNGKASLLSPTFRREFLLSRPSRCASNKISVFVLWPVSWGLAFSSAPGLLCKFMNTNKSWAPDCTLEIKYSRTEQGLLGIYKKDDGGPKVDSNETWEIKVREEDEKKIQGECQ